MGVVGQGAGVVGHTVGVGHVVGSGIVGQVAQVGQGVDSGHVHIMGVLVVVVGHSVTGVTGHSSSAVVYESHTIIIVIH